MSCASNDEWDKLGVQLSLLEETWGQHSPQVDRAVLGIMEIAIRQHGCTCDIARACLIAVKEIHETRQRFTK